MGSKEGFKEKSVSRFIFLFKLDENLLLLN